MRIITANLNGIRSAARKGFFDWLPQQQADVVCLQETRAQAGQLSDPMYFPDGYHCHYFDAQRPGYAGTGLYSRARPQHVQFGAGWEPLDEEGRWLRADYDGFSVVSLYVPSGSASEERQQRKFAFLDQLFEQFEQLRKEPREFIICADWNICHRQIDLKNWRSNQKNSGFLPEERAWLDRVFGELGFIDAFRLVDERPEQYTWWSNRGQAWAKNVGWRLDYQLVTPGLAARVRAASIYKDERFSDHAPLIMDYALEP